MSNPSKPLTIRLGELRDVMDAVELTKGLRGKIVGGKKRSAHLVPAEGGMMVEMFGSSTFVPIATSALAQTLRVDADLLAGFLRNSIGAFHPAEIVSLNIAADHLIARCGTLRVTLQLGAAPSSPPRGRPSIAVQTPADVHPPASESEIAPANALESSLKQPESRPAGNDGNQVSTSTKGSTESDLRLWDAETELDRVEEIERKLQSAKRQRPDYTSLKFFGLGWIMLIALSELFFGGNALAWVVVVCSVAVFAEAWVEFAAEREWEKERWKKKDEINEIVKRIDLLGLSASREPSCWVLKLKPITGERNSRQMD
jgi:hypothetical protein